MRLTSVYVWCVVCVVVVCVVVVCVWKGMCVVAVVLVVVVWYVCVAVSVCGGGIYGYLVSLLDHFLVQYLHGKEFAINLTPDEDNFSK